MRRKNFLKSTSSLILIFFVSCYLFDRSVIRHEHEPLNSEQGEILNSFENIETPVTKFAEFSATTHGGRGDESMNGDGDELSRLQKRGGKDYSEGHRRIYGSIITLIGGTETPQKAKILEVGTGIGFGLNLMLNDVQIKNYVGIEPCSKCLDHVRKKVVNPWLEKQREVKAELSKKKQAIFSFPTINFRNGLLGDFPISEIVSLLDGQADFTFCIEVAEHVQPEERLNFLTSLKKLTKGTLFLSTPNKDNRPKDGALSTKQWLDLLADSGFSSVTAIEWQWTTLFISQ